MTEVVEVEGSESGRVKVGRNIGNGSGSGSGSEKVIYINKKRDR